MYLYIYIYIFINLHFVWIFLVKFLTFHLAVYLTFYLTFYPAFSLASILTFFLAFGAYLWLKSGGQRSAPELAVPVPWGTLFDPELAVEVPRGALLSRDGGGGQAGNTLILMRSGGAAGIALIHPGRGRWGLRSRACTSGPAGDHLLILRLLFGSGGDHCNPELAVEVHGRASIQRLLFRSGGNCDLELAVEVPRNYFDPEVAVRVRWRPLPCRACS